MAEGRLVVTGYDNNTGNVFVRDGDSPGDRLTSTKMVWQVDRLPVPMDDNGEKPDQGPMPKEHGVGLQYVSIAPNTQLSGREYQPNDYHETDTVDLITMISGEVWMVLERNPKQVLLKAGDVFIQRGTPHLWHNKGTEPAVFTAVLIAAARTEKTPRTTSGAPSRTLRKA